jgi:hypothetical protein
MYLIEWLALPRTHAVVVGTTQTDEPTLEEAMDRAKKLFPKAQRRHPGVIGYRILKDGPPTLFEWRSPDAVKDA